MPDSFAPPGATMVRQKRKALLVLAYVLNLFVAPSVRAAGSDPSAIHIRIKNDRISEAFRYGLKRSASFGHLIASIEMLDRVVYIQEGYCRHSTRACIQLMPTPGAKNLLVKIDPRQPIRTVVAQLAHELYHAQEIAHEPDVVDAVSFRSLYDRIGQQHCSNDSDDACWETRAAAAFEALVWRELSSAHATPLTGFH